jgi:(E)-4-hydroxy-3-methylbut-2-enyl-diphosphate synthase
MSSQPSSPFRQPRFNFYRRRPTRTVYIGDVAVGGNNPIRIQSMTTSDTRDTEGTIREIEALVKGGCEIVRLTVPTKTDCDNLKNIRAAMKAKGLKVPLVADIHFTPSIALQVVEFVEKVRINPGNFVDKKLFKTFEISDTDYAAELIRIEEKFTPLVLKCKEYGVSMRVGTNHGSLSDRILNRYGDTPQGMVESALEFLRIAAKLNYHDIILSMKASNTQVMVAAYRLLAKRLDAEGMDYPFHLGVTEAGEGEDGRVKSAIGIGALLEDGIGDTIRVSLTEDSEHEIPVATMLAAPYNERIARENWNREVKTVSALPKHLEFLAAPPAQLAYARRESLPQTVGLHTIGGTEIVRVWSKLTRSELQTFWNAQNPLFPCEGAEFSATEVLPKDVFDLFHQRGVSVGYLSDNAAELVKIQAADKLTLILDDATLTANWSELARHAQKIQAHLEFCLASDRLDFSRNDLKDALAALIKTAGPEIGFSVASGNPRQDTFILTRALQSIGAKNVIHLRYRENELPAQLDASAQLGGLLVDGIGDSIQIDTRNPDFAAQLGQTYNILQGSRIRTSKTEYISCPSCGRTQFNLQQTTERIRNQTNHLKGLKIAIMGCIVNGPGEMADADFGYVGTGVGRISLYVGKECVERNIAEVEADRRLIELIKSHGRWVEPESAAL